MERAKWFFRTDEIEGLKERNDEEDGLSEEDQGSAVFFQILLVGVRRASMQEEEAV